MQRKGIKQGRNTWGMELKFYTEQRRKASLRKQHLSREQMTQKSKEWRVLGKSTAGRGLTAEPQRYKGVRQADVVARRPVRLGQSEQWGQRAGRRGKGPGCGSPMASRRTLGFTPCEMGSLGELRVGSDPHFIKITLAVVENGGSREIHRRHVSSRSHQSFPPSSLPR